VVHGDVLLGVGALAKAADLARPERVDEPLHRSERGRLGSGGGVRPARRGDARAARVRGGGRGATGRGDGERRGGGDKREAARERGGACLHAPSIGPRAGALTVPKPLLGQTSNPRRARPSGGLPAASLAVRCLNVRPSLTVWA